MLYHLALMATSATSRMPPGDIITLLTRSATSKRDKVPFFKFPRELRDTIYGGIEGEIRTENKAGNHAMMATFTERPVESCLLVSKQFRAQYLEAVGRFPVLRMEDSGNRFNYFQLPPSINLACRSDIVIYFANARDPGNHLAWLQRITPKLSKSCKLDIKIVVASTSIGDIAWVLQTLASYRNVTAIRIFQMAPGESWAPLTEAHPLFSQDAIGTWTPEQRWCRDAIEVFGSKLCKVTPTSTILVPIET